MGNTGDVPVDSYYGDYYDCAFPIQDNSSLGGDVVQTRANQPLILIRVMPSKPFISGLAAFLNELMLVV